MNAKIERNGTRTSGGLVVTYRQGLPASEGLPGTLVYASYGVMGDVAGPVSGSVAYEIRREAGAVLADSRHGDASVEYVVYRNGEHLIRYPSAEDAYARLKRHGVPSQWPGYVDLETGRSS